MAIVTHVKRYFSLYIFAASVVAFLGVAFVNRAVIANQLDSWQILPRPQGLTELYFTDDKKLPAAVKIDSMQNVTFTIHNLEHEATTYRYKLVATPQGATSGQAVGGGILRLHHDESQTINESIKIPPVDTSRVVISVELEYQGVPFGSKTLNAQHMAIQYWLNVVGHRA